MYKRKLFESMDELLAFLNDNKMNERYIIAVLPFEACNRTGEMQLRREYELVFKDVNKSCLL